MDPGVGGQHPWRRKHEQTKRGRACQILASRFHKCPHRSDKKEANQTIHKQISSEFEASSAFGRAFRPSTA